MELIVDEKKMKEIFKETFIELMKDKRELLHEIIVEAIEDIGMANAIKTGRKNKFVDEKKIVDILKK